MEKRIKALTWLVAISLLMNVYSFYQTAKIHRETRDYFNQYLQDIYRGITSDIGYLLRSINEIQEGNRWFTPAGFLPVAESPTPEELHLVFSWTLKEVEKGASVLFAYREQTSHEWIKVPAISKGVNGFTAALRLNPHKNYEYQIRTEGNIMRASEAQKIPWEIYKPIPLEYSGSGSSSSNGKIHNLEISFSQRITPLFDFYTVSAVTSQIYFNEEIKQIPLVAEYYSPVIGWKLVFPDELISNYQKITKLLLMVEYEDGQVHELDYTELLNELLSSITTR